jgi:transcriptional regulator with XRE-family HTH domain
MGNQGEELKDFIRNQMQAMNLSVRDFAKMCGVSHSTIVRLISEDPEKRIDRPDLQSIIKIANATRTDLYSVLQMAYPEEMQQDQLSPQARIIAQGIERLPEKEKKAIQRLIIEHSKGEAANGA